MELKSEINEKITNTHIMCSMNVQPGASFPDKCFKNNGKVLCFIIIAVIFFKLNLRFSW
jgi:hypothetical protein